MHPFLRPGPVGPRGPTRPDGGSSANDPNKPPAYFFVYLTGNAADTDDGQVTYTGYEVWVNPTGTTVEAVGTRRLTAEQPGVFVGGGSPPTPSYALARLGPGSGGRAFELFALPGFSGRLTLENACKSRFRSWRHTDCIAGFVYGLGRCSTVADQSFTGAYSSVAGGWVIDAPYLTTAAGETRLRVFRDPDDRSPRAEVTAGSGSGTVTVPGTYVGCYGDSLIFDLSDDDLCSGSGSGHCQDDSLLVFVSCFDCGIVVECGDDEIELPHDICVSVEVGGDVTGGTIAGSVGYHATFGLPGVDTDLGPDVEWWAGITTAIFGEFPFDVYLLLAPSGLGGCYTISVYTYTGIGSGLYARSLMSQHAFDFDPDAPLPLAVSWTDHLDPDTDTTYDATLSDDCAGGGGGPAPGAGKFYCVQITSATPFGTGIGCVDVGTVMVLQIDPAPGGTHAFDATGPTGGCHYESSVIGGPYDSEADAVAGCGL